MNLKVGIVGLPNVGKSTLFNALTRSASAQTANYPFCTINPNVGIVEVPDPRMKKLIDLEKPAKVVPGIVEFVDIAGLVKGASEGEGLGNKFLGSIRECQAIAEVVRIFDDPNIIHVHSRVNPKEDIEIIEAELILADLQTLNKRLERTGKETKTGDKDKITEVEVLKKIKAGFESGIKAADLPLAKEERERIQDLFLLTAKKILYIVNIDEQQINLSCEKIAEMCGIKNPAQVIPVCAKVEEELNSFSEEEAKDYLKELGLKESGLHHLIRSCYELLDLETFFTAGPTEVHAWTIKRGTLAPQAAGAIHTDFEKGFIRAEIISYDDYINCAGEAGAKAKGLMRLEGKEYVVQNGDVIYFRFAN